MVLKIEQNSPVEVCSPEIHTEQKEKMGLVAERLQGSVRFIHPTADID